MIKNIIIFILGANIGLFLYALIICSKKADEHFYNEGDKK